MNLSRFVVLQLLSTFACVLADEWSILPGPAEPKPSAVAEWKILDAPAALPSAPTTFDWLILPIADKPTDGNPDKGQAKDGRVSKPLAAPSLACNADCACGLCDCGEKCLCCSGYAELERVCLKSGQGAIVFVGDRGEDANTARREALARKLHFLSAKEIVGKDDAGKPAKFPAGTSELKPIGGALYFVPRDKRRIPVPDREPLKFERVDSTYCPNCQRAGSRRR